jgi:Siphovirus Gp157
MNSALKLYEITHQFQALEQLTDSDDLPAEVIADTLEALEGDFDAKAVQVAKFVLALEANAEAVRLAATQMMGRSNRIANRAASIKAYLQFHLQAVKRRRIESPELVIALRANPPAVVITDEHAVPAEFWVQPEPPPKRIDKKAIKAAIDKGDRVEGAYVEAGERIEIKF